jgi:hypothetical protein
MREGILVSINEITDEQIRADILHKLHRKRKWGGNHTAAQNLYKWCDQRYANRYKDAVKDLVSEGFLIPKPTHYGLQVSLNPRRRLEILQIIRNFFQVDI